MKNAASFDELSHVRWEIETYCDGGGGGVSMRGLRKSVARGIHCLMDSGDGSGGLEFAALDAFNGFSMLSTVFPITLWTRDLQYCTCYRVIVNETVAMILRPS